MLHVPQEAVGFVTGPAAFGKAASLAGRAGNFLRSIEEEWSTWPRRPFCFLATARLMFFCEVDGSRGRGRENEKWEHLRGAISLFA